MVTAELCVCHIGSSVLSSIIIKITIIWGPSHYVRGMGDVSDALSLFTCDGIVNSDQAPLL